MKSVIDLEESSRFLKFIKHYRATTQGHSKDLALHSSPNKSSSSSDAASHFDFHSIQEKQKRKQLHTLIRHYWGKELQTTTGPDNVIHVEPAAESRASNKSRLEELICQLSHSATGSSEREIDGQVIVQSF